MAKQAAKKKEAEQPEEDDQQTIPVIPTKQALGLSESKCTQLYGINRDQMMLLALQGKGPTEIGRELGCTKSNVSQVLKPFREAIKAYVAYKADPKTLWEFQEYRVLSSVNDEDIKKSNLTMKSAFAGTARDKINLFEGRMPIESENLVFNVVYNDNRQVNVMQPDNKATPQDVVVVADDNDSDTL